MSEQGCQGCRNGAGFPIEFSMAFQPIVDARLQRVFAYEALVRGADRSGAAAVLSQVDETNRYSFDQQCRVKAIELAAALKIAETGAGLSINFLPSAVYEPAACIKLTLETARRVGFPLHQIIFEFTESEQVNPEHLSRIIACYRKMGFITAVDDFGAGYSGLNLLARFQPDLIKLDMELVRGVDADPVRRALIEGVMLTCRRIGVAVLAEGIETEGEAETLREMGVRLLQGYWYARPAFEALPEPAWPAEPMAQAA